MIAGKCLSSSLLGFKGSIEIVYSINIYLRRLVCLSYSPGKHRKSMRWRPDMVLLTHHPDCSPKYVLEQHSADPTSSPASTDRVVSWGFSCEAGYAAMVLSSCSASRLSFLCLLTKRHTSFFRKFEARSLRP